MYGKILLHILFLTFSIAILFPILKEQHIVHKNDLNGTDIEQIYFRDAVLKEHIFPQWNPYMQQGIPMVADPLYAMYNPVESLPILIFKSYDTAIKFVYLISVFFACETMFLLCRKFMGKNISFFIALTYASGGFLAARINAGHIETIVPYGVLPLMILSILEVIKRKNVVWVGISALTLTYIMFAGNAYQVLYILYGIGGLCVYLFFKDKKALVCLIGTVLMFMLLSAVKLLPSFELQNYLVKLREPYLGSQTIISIVRYMFVPFEYPFNVLNLSQFISPAWGDLEKIAFIGPFPLIGIFWMITNLKLFLKDSKRLIFILFITLLLVLMPDLILNPIHWITELVPFIQYYRVPTRSFSIFSVIVLLIFGIFCNHVFLKKKIFSKLIFPILILNFVLTLIFFEVLLISPSSLTNHLIGTVDYKLYEEVFSKIKKENHSNYYVLAIYPSEVPEDIAYYNNQILLNTNYGLLLKNTPATSYAFVSYPPPSNYHDVVPGFAIDPESVTKSFPWQVDLMFKEGSVSVYRIPMARPFAAVINKNNNTISSPKVKISANKINVEAYASNFATLSILETNYPGWKVLIDDKKAELINNKFLEVQTIPGLHRYEFYYSSKRFEVGLIVSILTVVSWCVYLFKTGELKRFNFFS